MKFNKPSMLDLYVRAVGGLGLFKANQLFSTFETLPLKTEEKKCALSALIRLAYKRVFSVEELIQISEFIPEVASRILPVIPKESLPKTLIDYDMLLEHIKVVYEKD